MKTLIPCGAALAILGLTTASIFAQTQSSTSTTTTNYIQTSKLIGTKVRASQGDEIGEIKDVVLDQNGCMAYTVVSTGGVGSRVTGSSKTVAVPWSVYTTTSDPRIMTVRVEKEKIYSAPAFEYSRINEYSTSGYINNIYTHYGVAPTMGIGVGVSTGGGVSGSSTTTTGASTTTGVNATTGYNASTNANTMATPAATPSASPLTSASPMVSATPAATAAASASVTPNATAASASATAAQTGATATPASSRSPRSESADRGESAGGKAHSGMTPASSPRRGIEPTSESAAQSKSESSASPSEGKKARHHSSPKGSSEASPTPGSGD